MDTNKPDKKNLSERQLAANRANAQKSTGPTSEAGKSVSRYNRLLHGLSCHAICIPGEDKEMFEDFRAEFHNYFQPDNIVTRGMVDELAATRWKLIRIARAENCLIREQIAKTRAHNQKTYDQLSIDVETSIAIKALADESKVSERLDRHEARLQRHFSRLFNQLMQLRRDNPPAHDQQHDENRQTEPIPMNEHPVAADPQPIGQATAPGTVVFKPPVPPPNSPPEPDPAPQRPLTMAAGHLIHLNDIDPIVQTTS